MRLLAGGVDDVSVDAHLADLGQAGQRQDVGLFRGQLLGIADDDALFALRRDGEDAGLELVAGLLFHQGRVDAPVQRVLVGLPGGLQLDDLGLLPLAVELHGQPADGRAFREGDLEASLQHAVLRVLEAQAQLGEGKRAIHDRPGCEDGQLEPGSVGRGEVERRRLTLNGHQRGIVGRGEGLGGDGA